MSLDRIKEIDIRELLPSGVELKSNKCRCPLPGHGERSASFTFYPGNNSFNCFGCGRGGSVIDFWMIMQGLDFSSALRDLAERYRITLEKWTPEQEIQQAAARKRGDALTFSASYYARQLTEESPAWAYLIGRGFTAETIRELRFGYANKTLWASVNRHPAMLSDAGLSMDDMMDAGVFTQHPETGSIYETFRDRIVFPILKRGRVIGAAGRALPSADGKAAEPKYLNLKAPFPCLYLEENIGAEAILCEGLPDPATLHQAGFPGVGQPGTSGLSDHAPRFAKCRVVYVCMDSDKPGQDAIAKVGKAIHMIMEAGEVRIISLPHSIKDINEWAMSLEPGAFREAFKEAMAGSTPLLDWMMRRIPDGLGAVERERAVRELLELVMPMGALRREEALEDIKNRFKLRKQDLRNLLKRATQDGNEGEHAESTLSFESIKERIPAQDYTFTLPVTGNFTVFLPVARQTVTEDGKPVHSERIEPVMISVIHNEGKVKIDAKPCIDLKLTDRERRRIPTESGALGRWRPEKEHTHSIERFLAGQVKNDGGYQLFCDIKAAIKRYLWLPEPIDHDVAAVWIMGTYVYQLFETFPYLHLHGVRESGKSNLARIIEELAFNAMKSSSQTESVIFRSVESNCRTVIIEEAEKLNNPQPGTSAHDLSLIANDGYKKGAKAERNDQDPVTKQWRPMPYDVYSPKVFASINELNSTLSSRCIIIACLRATAENLKESKIKDLSQAMHKERKIFASLRDRLYCWALMNFQAIHRTYTHDLVEDPDLAHLRGREYEMWLPLISIAYCLDKERAGGNVEKFAELHQVGELISFRFIDSQKGRERERRSSESEGSRDVAIIDTLHDNITAGFWKPAQVRMDGGDLFIIHDLAELVTIEMRDMGLIGADKSVRGNSLTSLLGKLLVISDESKVRPRIGADGQAIRCIAIDLKKLKDAAQRLGCSSAKAAN